METRKKKCPTCEKFIEESKYILHEAYCTRHNIKCKFCKEILNKNQIDEHIVEKHNPNKCRFCEIICEKSEKINHEQFCRKKPHFCNLCKTEIPSDVYSEHYQ